MTAMYFGIGMIMMLLVTSVAVNAVHAVIATTISVAAGIIMFAARNKKRMSGLGDEQE